MTRATRLLAALGLAGAIALPGVASAAAPRLDYRGRVLGERQAEVLMRAAMQAPGDSSALAAALGGLVARLQDLGHLSARAAARWDTVDARPRLVVTVEEGPLERWSAISLRAPSAADSAHLAAPLGLSSGEPASPAAAREAISRSVGAAADRGYAYARLGVRGWHAGPDGVRLELEGALGPRVTVDSVRIAGLGVTRRALALRALGPLTGRPYRRATAEQAADRLARLGLFDRVTYEGLTGESDWSRGTLLYRVREPRYNRFQGVVGRQSEGTTVGLVSLELGNLLGTGRAISLSWQSRGKGLADLSARYAEPFVLGTPVRLEGALSQQVQDTIYVRTRWGARARYALSGQEGVEAGYEEERVVQQYAEVEEARVQSTVFALDRDARDDPEAPRRGSQVRVSASQEFKTEILRPSGRRTARASVVELHGEWDHPLVRSSVLSVGLQAAGRFSSQRVLAYYERFPVGGAASLRGQDEEAFRVDRYALTRSEWRWFLGPGGVRAFVFWDHAWMETREPLATGGDHLIRLQRDGVGVGLRLAAAGGLVGVDYGLEPGRAALEGKIHLQLVTTF